MKARSRRMGYALAFALLLLIEVLIALFLHDRFIRPYGGDVLVTVLLCCFVRILRPVGIRLLPLWVFLFAAAVEIAQYLDVVSLLGLNDVAFFRILLGTTFSVTDLLCYAAGCALFFLVETLLRRRRRC